MGSGPVNPDARRPFINRPFWAPSIPQGSPAALLQHQMAPDFGSLCPLAPKRRSPDAHAWQRPKPHTDRECGQRFHPPLHTSYTVGCLSAPLSLHTVFSKSVPVRHENKKSNIDALQCLVPDRLSFTSAVGLISIVCNLVSWLIRTFTSLGRDL
jgi:hypothetical protein